MKWLKRIGLFCAVIAIGLLLGACGPTPTVPAVGPKATVPVVGPSPVGPPEARLGQVREGDQRVPRGSAPVVVPVAHQEPGGQVGPVRWQLLQQVALQGRNLPLAVPLLDRSRQPDAVHEGALTLADPVNVERDLIAWYPFTNGSALDATGNGHDGTVHDAIAVPDRFGTPDAAFDFPGEAKITIPHDPDLKTQTFTWSIWFRTTDTAGLC